MYAFARLFDMFFDRPEPEHVPLESPRAEVGPTKPMVGILARLSPEQRARALSYDGPETHGDDAFRLKA